MTKTEIKNIIKATTTNAEIKWTVLKANAKEIELTNSYLQDIGGLGYWSTFLIKSKKDGDCEYISVRDTNMNEQVGLLLKDNEWEERHPEWNDFHTTEQGFKRAIACAVNYFNHCY